ncbi:hypothetical protein [Shewanella saliphila]|uniref:Twin-arginine translocation signal domain-containing protein n=1 Tax=Shewanella saliphila TaxID=2282698 RepID=A0ABQ2QDR2_9GAMM|nr:hypothetical protein [Shewanella saliphila]MCL1103618.1 hypothetical protein [Shewanella saliphila]GGP71480.1 hypothetical protein GCM10009409_39450 [Shewanella saliphila]
MNKSTERRKFLKICAATSIVAVLPLGIYVLDNESRLYQLVEDILTKHLPGRLILQADIEKFSKDFFIERYDIALKTHVFSVLAPLVRVASGFDEDLHGKIDNLERMILTKFLLNSDFFANDAKKKTIIYNGATSNICRTKNPFAQFLTP